MATFFKVKNKSGEVRWRWRVIVDGRPYWGRCPTKECAKTCAAKEEAEVKSGRLRGPATVAEMFDRYEAEHLPTIPDSAPLYRYHLGVWRQHIGSRRASQIGPQEIVAARAKIAAMPNQLGKRRRPDTPAKELGPLKGSTVNRFLTTLSSVFSWASSPEIGLVASNPVKLVKKLPETKRTRWLTRLADQPAERAGEAELVRLLRACRDSESPILFDVVVLLLATGCRENEVLSLRRDDVRLGDGGFTLRPESTKTEQGRWVNLHGAALEIVRQRMDKPAEGNPYLFPGRPGMPGKTKGRGHAYFPRRAWYGALEHAGIVNFHPHDLRHTAASWSVMAGRNLREVQALTGHTSVESVSRYAHLAGDHARSVSGDVSAQLEAGLAVLDAERPSEAPVN